MLLQKNIVKKYLNLLSEEQTQKPWEQYQSYFLNEEIQTNIHKIKEEQFQEGFLRELFVKVLGYTINPSPNYNLTTELKNEVGSKKADGAILIDEKVIGVIELKDHKTPDLASIETQAFGYKNKHKETRLVIISNFEKLRLYIDDAVEYREWDIFNMTADDFRELYLCMAWQQVAHGIAIQIKSESVSNEEQITKALYKDYSEFKRVLFADILANNPVREGDDEKQWQLLLFKKTQKLLDRLLFILFAEDADKEYCCTFFIGINHIGGIIAVRIHNSPHFFWVIRFNFIAFFGDGLGFFQGWKFTFIFCPNGSFGIFVAILVFVHLSIPFEYTELLFATLNIIKFVSERFFCMVQKIIDLCGNLIKEFEVVSGYGRNGCHQ